MENNGYGDRYIENSKIGKSGRMTAPPIKIENLGRKWPYALNLDGVADLNSRILWHTAFRIKSAMGTKIRDIRAGDGGITDNGCRLSVKIGNPPPLDHERYIVYNDRNRYILAAIGFAIGGYGTGQKYIRGGHTALQYRIVAAGPLRLDNRNKDFRGEKNDSEGQQRQRGQQDERR